MPYQRGSGFVGLQQYLAANQQAAQQMGNAIAGGVEDVGNAARGAVDTGAQKFDAAAQAGTPQYDQATADLEGGALGDAARNGRIVYNGPQQLSDVVDTTALTKQTTNAEQQAQLAGSDAGRAVLLGQKYGPGYTTTGGSQLDSYLAGRGAGDRLQADVKAFGKLQDYLGTAKANATARAAQGGTDAKALSDRYAREFPLAQQYTAPPPQATPTPAKAPVNNQPTGQYVGGAYVPYGSPQQTHPIAVPGASGTIQPQPSGPPKKPKGSTGGQYVGGTWVPNP